MGVAMNCKATKKLPVLDELAIAELERGLPGGSLDAALETFANEIEKREVEIRDSLSQRNYDELAEVAHGLKGSAATFCAPALAQAALLLEERLSGGDAMLIDASTQCLSDEVSQAVHQFRRYLARKRESAR